MALDSTYIHTDVTAVASYNNLILAGIGSSMYVYSTDSTKPLYRLICLKGQKIYGFKRYQDECSIIVFGGKQMTIVLGPRLNQEDLVFERLFEPVLCDDWLHSVAWTAGGTEVAVLTAHNVVQKYSSTLSLKSRHSSKDNSIIYSGLLLPLDDDVLVLAGTVYSEVIIHVCSEEEPLHRLTGHKGVIFSISCYPDKNIIVTTSDDRSVRIWGQNTPQEQWSTLDYWKREIVCKHELYGHYARVMRSSITNKHIVSVGEDSLICFWTHDGVLDRKVKRHQNAGIWSIDTHKELIITGGGDGGVTVQSSAIDNYKSHVLNLDIGKPKHISYSSFRNIYILTENNRFVYYDTKEGVESDVTIDLELNATFHAFSVSPNRLMCAIAGRKSNIQIATEVQMTDMKITVEIKTVKLEDEVILSVHWAGNDHLIACSERGVITVLRVSNALEKCTVFELPNSEERWLTCAANSQNTFVFGDRCGGIHVYKIGSRHPLKSFSKIHGRYGPTSISISNGEMVTTGRDRTIKYFKIEDEITLTGAKELDFHWVERFLDPKQKIVCGFREKMFIVFNLKTNEKLVEIPCGGGHRSWDVLYHHDDIKSNQEMKLMYLKNSSINIESVIISTTFSVAKGSHSKEINCLKSHQFEGRTVFISGGEDTTLRVSTLDHMVFEDVSICKNLSSVRTVKIYAENNSDEVLVISAGGRAQLCIKQFKFIETDTVEVKTKDLVDYMLKGTDKKRKGDISWRNVTKDSDPETRIMDLDYIKNGETYTIFAGCSDARVRVFKFEADTFEMIDESEDLTHCILKTVCVKFLNQDILITCSTRGEVAFWSVSTHFEPFFSTTTNKSGINCIATSNLKDNRLMIATGGDDNALHINVFTIDCDKLSSLQVQHSLVLDRYHSSAITGLCLVDDYILTTSIDQRITLFKWKVTEKIACDFVYQTFSDVSDIKGMDVISRTCSSLSVCVFGKGIEMFDIPTET